MSKRPIHLVIPMSGQGTRYQKAGYKDPKPMIPVNNVPMIERLLEHFPHEWNTTFVLAENHKNTGLLEVLRKCRPRAKTLFVPVNHQGPSFPLQRSLDHISDEESILVSYCDFGMIWDPWHFRNFVSYTNCDACLISYRGFHAHYLSEVPYAYSKLDNELVKKVKEKGSFTSQRENEFASCGAYYFKNKDLLEKSLAYQIKHEIKVNEEYYTSLTVEALLQMNPLAHVRIFEIPYFFQWGTPNDLKDFEYWEKTWVCKNKFESARHLMRTDQILIPMAGLGSRFKNLTSKRKPFIKISGVTMFENAIETLPTSSHINIISLDEFKNEIPKKYTFKGLPNTPPGQALSVEAGMNLLDEHQSVLVSACDHGVVIDPKKWENFIGSDFDAAVFCVKGFPGTRRSPNSYSYVETHLVADDSVENSPETYVTSEHYFPEVKNISLKKPVSNNPSLDFLLVGTFWFKNAKILSEGLRELKKANRLIHQELYLDGIFNYLNILGFKSVIFPLDGYFNWGDPDSLKEALYWKEVFSGHCLSQRSPFPGVEF